MNSKLVRKVFLEYFYDKGHKIVSSAPITKKDDPTLMFTNAGMNQFKDIFLGDKQPINKRVANTQKCLRVSGKHNDLEEVGLDTYHHTMFEMLGNWSFGDYFKEEAIEWSWKLLIEEYKIDPKDLYVTIFSGDKEDQVPLDIEAKNIWKKYIAEEKILAFDKKDNFWEMGDIGPCGPSSEIHIDLRSEEEKRKQSGKELVNTGHSQVIEIWNLVFIQFNRLKDGHLEPLKEYYVDTGMGFERLCMVLQEKNSTYDTDVFTDIIAHIEKKAGIKYGDQEKTDVAVRVLTDHIRAVTFSIADGVLPSNTGAGYVIRRVLRRAIRYANHFLHIKEPYLYQLVDLLANQFEGQFPEVIQQKEIIQKVIQEEEISFLRTLENGMKRLYDYCEENRKSIEGTFAFELYDTFGFPIDLTQLIAQQEFNLSVDEIGFQQAMEAQKNRARKATEIDTSDWTELISNASVDFMGYDQVEVITQITKYRAVKQKGKEIFQIVLQKTPFYAESGGQVGDTGVLEVAGEKISVLDTKKENELIVHYTNQLPKQIEGEIVAKINLTKRKESARNHSATHLLHAALREVLGNHVQQKGSLVSPDGLRFDFSHFSKVEESELTKIETIVNQKILANIPLLAEQNVPLEEAKAKGAMALFGEKYGDTVRVITFDPTFSVELCGGTHVQATGEIGLFKIISESSIAAGIRRIEAFVGEKAINYINGELSQFHQVKELVKNPKDIVIAVDNLLKEQQKLNKELEKLQLAQASSVKDELLEEVQSINGMNYIGKQINLTSSDAIKNLVFNLKNQVEDLFLVVGAEVDGKALLTVAISENLVKSKELNAGNVVRQLAKYIQGGGGGQAFYATAGGKQPQKLGLAIEEAKKMVESL